MSNEQAKIKNSTRRHRDETAIKKQLKIAKQHNKHDYAPEAEKQPHRYAKHHAMDCGNANCYVCGNPRKTHKDKLTAQEKRIFQDLDKIRSRHNNGNIPDQN